MLDYQALAPDTIRRIKRAEYDRMVEVGIFSRRDRIELLRGELVTMSPQGRPHLISVTRLSMMLTRQVGPGVDVRPQVPIVAADESEPEPDVAVVTAGSFGRDDDRCMLIVEVADSSTRKDGTVKAALYAESGFPVYWLVDLNRREVLVHGDPRDGAYHRIERRLPGDVLTLDGQPGVAVPVAEIVPPAA